MQKSEEPLVVLLHSHLVTNRRLRFFGHIARSSPREDHHRALAAAIRQVRPDWKRPIRRPSHTWLRAIQADRGPLNFGLTTAWRQALLEMNSDILWTQQCSSGVHYERRRRCHDLPCLCHIVIAIARSHFSECHILRVSRTLQLVRALTVCLSVVAAGLQLHINGHKVISRQFQTWQYENKRKI